MDKGERAVVDRTEGVGPAICWCCAHILDRPVRAAVYLWIAQPSGVGTALCESCCAIWRANALEDPHLAPARIMLIS